MPLLLCIQLTKECLGYFTLDACPCYQTAARFLSAVLNSLPVDLRAMLSSLLMNLRAVLHSLLYTTRVQA